MSHPKNELSADERREIIARELVWHENEAERRSGLNSLLYAPPAFDTIINAMLNYLGGKPNDHVLDMACGEGKETLIMAQRGWTVFSLDLSHAQLVRAREMVKKANSDLQVHFIQANAEQMPFAQNAHHIIYGKAIIHHLDLDTSPAEINRVLTNGGKAVFAEPMAYHPLIWLGRRITPNMRTIDEHPLTYTDISRFLSKFDNGTIEENFLFAPLATISRAIPHGESIFQTIHPILARFDRWLMRHFRFLKPLAWYTTTYVQKI